MKYQSTKTYSHEVGLSACFRQHRAESHCRYLHGYALAVTLVFETDELDCRNWVVDFGSLKSLKGRLEDAFDHKTVVAEDDPHMEWFKVAEDMGLCQLRILPAVGCEMFAEYIYGMVDVWLLDNGYAPRVVLKYVEVREHGANSARYCKGDLE